MSQPASNVDSVILKWCIEAQAEQFPASLWMRDCFSSVFTEAATEAMSLANQLSCLVAEKCASKLQITDTDFAKQFKALVRNKLQELRSEWQAQPKESFSVWKVGALQIVTAVVYAQEYMSEKNLKDSWVLKAAVRNGLLAYRPCPETGKLEQLLSQPWTQTEDLNLSFGTALRQTEVWDYWNPSQEEAEEAQEIDIDAQLVEDLELELQNSLSLRLAPALRRAALRRLGTAEYKYKASERSKKRSWRAKQRGWRQLVRSKMAKKLAEKLQSQSRKEALEEMQPETKQKAQKAKKKLKLSEVAKASLKNKPSAKTKPSLKSKPSQIAKNLKKQKSKAELAKVSKALVETEPSEPPPLLAPAEPPSDQEEEQLLGLEVVVTSEAAGRVSFGKKGKLTHKTSAGMFTLFAETGTYQVKADWLEVQDPSAKVPVGWPKWTQLSKRDARLMLSQIFANPLDQIGLSVVEWEYQKLLQCPLNVNELEDQHVWLGWLLLRWKHLKAKEEDLETQGIMCLDPVLSHVLAVQDVESYAQNLKEAIKQSFHSAIKLLLVPVYSNEHWTLLVAQRKEGDPALTWRRYDTLSQEHAESHAAQVTLGTLFDSSFQLPQLQNLCKQPKGSNACGGFVLHYMELEIKLFKGEVPELWPTDGWKAWKQRLQTAAQKLHTEQQKCLDEAQVLKAKEKSQQEEVAKQLSKAQEKITKLKNVTSQAYLVAQEQINKNSVKFTYKNLSPESTHKVLTLRHQRVDRLSFIRGSSPPRGMIQSMVMMRELPGARSVALWVISLYAFTTVTGQREGQELPGDVRS
eukprot:Skav207096  [mRNA]  locus=scaffold2123:25752:29784:+ [translate_table: standard]